MSNRDDLVEALNMVKEKGLSLVLMMPGTGYLKLLLESIQKEDLDGGSQFLMLEREWDRLLYPQARKGFFTFKKHIPEAIETLGL